MTEEVLLTTLFWTAVLAAGIAAVTVVLLWVKGRQEIRRARQVSRRAKELRRATA